MSVAFRTSAAAGLLAALSLGATPLAAVDLPASSVGTSIAPAGAWNPDDQNADNHRRWRRDRGVDAGDVIGGVLVIGAIAAIASAASKASRDGRGDYRDGDYRYRDYRTGEYRDGPYDYRASRGDSRYAGGQGIDRAVEMCVRQIERDARVERIDSADRTAQGWRVSGTLYNGDGFSCRIGNDGRIEDVDYGRGLTVQDNQYDADRYARARMEHEGNWQPAAPYPGGPVEQDYLYAEDDQSTGG